MEFTFTQPIIVLEFSVTSKTDQQLVFIISIMYQFLYLSYNKANNLAIGAEY